MGQPRQRESSTEMRCRGGILLIFSLTMGSLTMITECKPEIPTGLVRGIVESMQEYENTKTCASFMKIIIKVTDMEELLCSVGDDALCVGAKGVALFFTKLLFEKLPKCLKGLVLPTRNKIIHSFRSTLG